MKRIDIYDDNYADLEKMAEADDTTIAEVLADIIYAYHYHVLDDIEN